VICKWAQFGYKALPLTSWRAFLLKRHLDQCPVCQTRLLDNETIRSMGMTAATLQAELPLWPVPEPHFKTRIPRLGWRYAFGFSLVAILVWVTIEGLNFVQSPALALPKGLIREVEETDESRVFAVLTAEIGTEPARSVIFKPRYPGMTIVWFEKIKN
jgi:hypothetical protein